MRCGGVERLEVRVERLEVRVERLEVRASKEEEDRAISYTPSADEEKINKNRKKY